MITKHLELRPYGPGKFNTMLDAYIYKLSLNGCDDETGSVDEIGEWYGLLKGIQVDGPFCDVAAAAELTDDEKQVLREHKAGCIVAADSQGFVDVTYYATRKALDKSWRQLVATVETETE
jgi:hypothetical protein